MALRQAAGLSQTELGELIGEKQQNVAFWEQSERPPRSDVLPRIAEVLSVTVEDILDIEKSIPVRKTGKPVGKLRRVFDEVSKLPRRQQDKIIDVVDALIVQYKQKAES